MHGRSPILGARTRACPQSLRLCLIGLLWGDFFCHWSSNVASSRTDCIAWPQHGFIWVWLYAVFKRTIFSLYLIDMIHPILYASLVHAVVVCRCVCTCVHLTSCVRHFRMNYGCRSCLFLVVIAILGRLFLLCTYQGPIRLAPFLSSPPPITILRSKSPRRFVHNVGIARAAAAVFRAFSVADTWFVPSVLKYGIFRFWTNNAQ